MPEPGRIFSVFLVVDLLDHTPAVFKPFFAEFWEPILTLASPSTTSKVREFSEKFPGKNNLLSPLQSIHGHSN